jgi:aromatase
MAHTKNSIVIKKDIDQVFDVTNDIPRWTELFDEYVEAKILKREDKKVTFRLTNKEGKSWRSSRIIDREKYLCTAEREEPKFPFKYMHLKWTYRAVPAGTEMTWEQDFEMDPTSGYTNEKAQEAINEHSRANMEKIKKIIEEGD